MRRHNEHDGVEVEADDRDQPADGNLSAELRYEAPLATFDGDEWTEFLLDVPPSAPPGVSVTVSPSAGDTDTFTETFSGSLEDLVNTFDAKITQCFRNYSEHADEIAPVQIRTQDELMADSQ